MLSQGEYLHGHPLRNHFDGLVAVKILQVQMHQHVPSLMYVYHLIFVLDCVVNFLSLGEFLFVFLYSSMCKEIHSWM